jgi:hypothetical protein
MLIKMSHAIADTGATSIFVMEGTPMKNVQPTAHHDQPTGWQKGIVNTYVQHQDTWPPHGDDGAYCTWNKNGVLIRYKGTMQRGMHRHFR